MHPISILTFGIFFAGYITARWDLVTRLYELAIFAWNHGVIVRGTALEHQNSTDEASDSRCLRLCWTPGPVLAPSPTYATHRSSRSRFCQSIYIACLRF